MIDPRTVRRSLVSTAVAVLALAACIPETGPTSPTSTTTPSGSTTTSTEPEATTSTTTTTTVPSLVAITASSPASPSTSLSPRLSGFAPAATSVVRVFPTTDCSGPASGTSDLATFQGAGILVTVGLGSTTSFTALASGPGSLHCSAPFEYVNTLTPPNAFESEPNDGVLQADPISVDVGAPAEVSAHLDGATVSDLFVFTVAAGRSIRIETFDSTGLTCDGIDTRIYLSPLDGGLGGNDDDAGVDQCSRLAPGEGTSGANLVAVAGGDYLLNVQGLPTTGHYRLRIEVFP